MPEKLHISPEQFNKEQFAKAKRQIAALQRQGKRPQVELLEKCKRLDRWLTKNTTYWNSNFEFTREES